MPSEKLLPRLLLGLLMALLLYLPNQAQIQLETGVRGLNAANALFLLALIVMLMTRRTTAGRTPLKWPLLFFFMTLSWALLIALKRDSTAWVQDLTVYKNAVFYPLLFFLYFHAVRDLRAVRMLVLLTLFVVLTSGVLGLRQALDYGIATFNEYKRVSAPFGWSVTDSNRAAIFFCIQLQPVMAAALFLKSRGWLRIACAGIFLLGVFVVFHTYSRQAYGILAVTTLLIAMRRHLLLAALALISLYHYELWVPETVVERVQMTMVDPLEAQGRRRSPVSDFDPLLALDRPLAVELDRHAERSAEAAQQDAAAQAEEAPQFDASTESRFTIWAGAWELIQRQPTGIGLNRFRHDISGYVPAEHAGKDAHNYYVLLATEAGIVAPLFLLALLGALLLLGQRLAAISDDEECRMLGVGFVMATIAVILGNVYGTRFADGDVMANYWILAALVARTLAIKEEERLERQRRPRQVAMTPGHLRGRGVRRPVVPARG